MRSFVFYYPSNLFPLFASALKPTKAPEPTLTLLHRTFTYCPAAKVTVKFPPPSATIVTAPPDVQYTWCTVDAETPSPQMCFPFAPEAKGTIV